MKTTTKLLISHLMLMTMTITMTLYVIIQFEDGRKTLGEDIAHDQYTNLLSTKLIALHKNIEKKILTYRFSHAPHLPDQIKQLSLTTQNMAQHFKGNMLASRGQELISHYMKNIDSRHTLQNELILAIQQLDNSKIRTTFARWSIISQQASANLADIKGFSHRKLDRTVSRANVESKKMTYLLLATAVFDIIVITLLFLYFSRTISKPLKELKVITDHFAEGDLSSRAPVVLTRTGDEIGDLSRSFNVMGADLQNKYAEQLKLTNELARSRDRLRSIINTSIDGIVVIDKKGFILEFSPAAENIFGYSESEVFGHNVKILMPDLYRSEHDEYLQRFQQFAETKIKGFSREVVGRFKDGRTFPIEVGVSEGESETGVFYTATIRDISERKHYEKELIAARQAAEVSSQSKSNFLANMSHEIRTPMNGVIGMVDILMHLNLTEEQRRMIKTIYQSSTSLLRIIDDILDTSKIEAGELDLIYAPVHLRSAIERVIETLTPVADKMSVQLNLYIDLSIPEWISTDDIRLRQILLNLVSNAIKFSQPDTDSKGGNKRGDVSLHAHLTDTGLIRFTISDNGIGMDEDAMANLFKPFVQAEESTTRKFGGTGLGLMISKNLVRLFGGDINVKSTPGEGAIFTFELPLIKAEGEVKQPDISGLNIVALVNDSQSRKYLNDYLAYGGSAPRFADNEADLKSILESDNNEIIVVLALDTVAENERLFALFNSESNPRQFLCLTSQRADPLGLLQANKYVIQQSPICPGELLMGLGVLSGRALPEEELKVSLADTNLAERSLEWSASSESLEPKQVTPLTRQKSLILLVEDNEVNQEVISYQLGMLGYRVEVANDGQQGLKKWQDGQFDLVLTDCHMPVLDGFSMTKAIRSEEIKKGHIRVPIIAITANALQGEAENCLAAGMDDYLSKPVELRQIGRTLNKWLAKAGPDNRDSTTKKAAPDTAKVDGENADLMTSSPAVDPSALSKIIGDDPALNRKFLDKFVDQVAVIAREIHTAFKSGSAGQVGELGHKLKSSARAIGANELADWCGELEQAGKTADWEGIKTLLPRLDELFDAVKKFVENG